MLGIAARTQSFADADDAAIDDVAIASDVKLKSTPKMLKLCDFQTTSQHSASVMYQ